MWLAEPAIDINLAEEMGETPIRTQKMIDWTVNVIYECIDCDYIFTKEHLLLIQEIENII